MSHPAPHLAWDIGTAYDLFISLYVLHRPDDFGLRPSWAAGVRSRLPPEDRKTLEEADLALHAPIIWIYNLPAPKDAASALWALRQVPAGQRLAVLSHAPAHEKTYLPVLQAVAERGAWSERDVEILSNMPDPECKNLVRSGKLPQVLTTWAHAAAFGERYLAALQAYQQNFFAEEEARILPMLQDALVQAQDLAGQMTISELVEHLSQGLEIQEVVEQDELILVPSFWSTPLSFFGASQPKKLLLTFGARPADASLIPGEAVPDRLLQTLKALADPTRLRILRYLAQEPLPQAELARRLRLRPPTVTHHLRALRVAGLVHIVLEKVKDDNDRYMTRREALQELGDLIDEFLSVSDSERDNHQDPV